jgi:hypothetical protein
MRDFSAQSQGKDMLVGLKQKQERGFFLCFQWCIREEKRVWGCWNLKRKKERDEAYCKFERNREEEGDLCVNWGRVQLVF